MRAELHDAVASRVATSHLLAATGTASDESKLVEGMVRFLATALPSMGGCSMEDVTQRCRLLVGLPWLAAVMARQVAAVANVHVLWRITTSNSTTTGVSVTPAAWTKASFALAPQVVKSVLQNAGVQQDVLVETTHVLLLELVVDWDEVGKRPRLLNPNIHWKRIHRRDVGGAFDMVKQRLRYIIWTDMRDSASSKVPDSCAGVHVCLRDSAVVSELVLPRALRGSLSTSERVTECLASPSSATPGDHAASMQALESQSAATPSRSAVDDASSDGECLLALPPEIHGWKKRAGDDVVVRLCCGAIRGG